MIILDSVDRSLEVKLAGSVVSSQLPIIASYVEIGSNLFAPKTNALQTNSATAVTVVGAPSSGRQHQLKFLSVRNSDSADRTVTLQYNDNGTKRIVTTVSLSVGDTLVYNDGEGFRVMDSTGQIKGAGTTGATGPAGPSGAEMTAVAGTSLSALRIVAADDTTGKVEYADKDTLETIKAVLGMSTNAVSTDEDVNIVTQGVYEDLAWSWNMASDVALFLGANGAIVQGPPSGLATLQVGFAITATKIFLRIGVPVINA